MLEPTHAFTGYSNPVERFPCKESNPIRVTVTVQMSFWLRELVVVVSFFTIIDIIFLISNCCWHSEYILRHVLRKKMSNQTTMTEFLLLGFSEVWELQILHFVVFLVIYLASLVGNFLIFMAIAFNHHLHTPMYFFLMNLSIVDLGSISVIVPKSMANSLMNTNSISYAGCVTQVFFLIFLLGGDFALLTIMAYDRYVAICQPLHYETMMNSRACVQMAAGAWIGGILNSVLHTGNTFALSFCGGNMVDQFFCEIPQLLKLACSNTYLSEFGLFVFSACLLLGCFIFIIVSYVQIFKSVLRIPSEQG
ncbi:olfactory receptor 14A16-like [Chelonoidis abingdonii]|uniref:olfactory receptor 14A16-like n=1 Tax=Chelonoidis abingdonii TaxID=106734 RepID=UPI003F491B69